VRRLVRRLILDSKAAIFQRNLSLVTSAATREWNLKTGFQAMLQSSELARKIMYFAVPAQGNGMQIVVAV
jgi:hypothetical protein